MSRTVVQPAGTYGARKLLELNLSISTREEGIDVEWFRLVSKRHRWNITEHFHSSFELHYVVDGECSVTIGGATATLRAGEYVVIPPNVVHASSGSNRSFQKYVLSFQITNRNGDAETTHLIRALSGPSRPPTAMDARTGALFDWALVEATDRGSGYLHTLRSLVILILFRVARSAAPDRGEAPPADADVSLDDARLDTVESYLRSRTDAASTSVDDIARHLNISPKQLYRIVSRGRGTSPMKLISAEKVRRAKSLLRDDSLSLAEVAERLGFSNEYYFNRFFKREEGLPPGTYRASRKGSPSEGDLVPSVRRPAAVDTALVSPDSLDYREAKG